MPDPENPHPSPHRLARFNAEIDRALIEAETAAARYRADADAQTAAASRADNAGKHDQADAWRTLAQRNRARAECAEKLRGLTDKIKAAAHDLGRTEQADKPPQD